MTEQETARMQEQQARFETAFSEMRAEAEAYCTAREGVLKSRQATAAVYVAARRVVELEMKLEALEKLFGFNIDNHDERLCLLEAGRAEDSQLASAEMKIADHEQQIGKLAVKISRLPWWVGDVAAKEEEV